MGTLKEENFSSPAGYQISKEKICNLLKPDTWFCDQAINICLENIRSNAGQIRLTDSFFYAELVSPNERLSFPKWTTFFKKFETWVIPVNIDYHWSLILLKNKRHRVEIECWDSLPTESRLDKIKSQLLCSYRQYSVKTKNFSISYQHDCYIQNDRSNCGVFLIGNILAFIFNKKNSNMDSKNARIAIALMILNTVQPFQSNFHNFSTNE